MNEFPPVASPAELSRVHRLSNESRILVLAPISNDARLTAAFLAKAGLGATICQDLLELSAQLQAGCGALLIAEEAFAGRDVRTLVSALAAQPSWSDLPLILIMASGDPYQARPRHFAALEQVGNISIIERPVRPDTLISTCEVALRSRRRQYQVRDLVIELSHAHRRKDEFLAMLAHELRNPLAAISSAASLLSHASKADAEWAASVIARQSSQLAHLIDDLLDVSRITTGKIRLRREVIDIASILDRTRDAAGPIISAKKHELVCHYPSGALWVDADPTRLEQVFLNLLTNAAKYTPPGGRIEISGQLADGEIVVSVCDNGVGIAPQRIPEMFQLFAQGERSIARSEGGLGIGLTIVQKLVEMHGGRVEAHSDGPNRGSIFRVTIPVAARPTSHNGTGKTSSPSASHLRVLIVDDNIDTAQGLARLLARAGHKISLAHDGLDALERARALAPDVIILDIGLPGMDGFQVVQSLRQEDRCADAVIIAVTGYGQPEDRQRSLEAGFDYHLVKPVDFQELAALLHQPSPRLSRRADHFEKARSAEPFVR